MKLITLNLWGGKIYEPLIEFIKKHASDTDVFLFQEMMFGDNPGTTEILKARIGLFSEVKALLSEFTAYSNPSDSDHFQNEKISNGIGQAMFIRNSFNVKEHGNFYCFDEVPFGAESGGKTTGNCMWADISIDDKVLTILNIHGIWQLGTAKQDTPERLTQSKVVRDFLDKKEGKKMVCGDFNLRPDTKSMMIMEDGMRNLIKEFKIKSTRSEFYEGGDKSMFADYIITSPEVEVLDFKVLEDPVSDHLPLYLDFK